MLRNVALKTLRDQRRAFGWWALGIVLIVVSTVPFYPSIRDQAQALNEYIEKMPEALRAVFIGQIGDITSPEGFLNSQLFAFLGPLLFSIFAIGSGTRAVAGEERAGTLDLLLSTPLPRRRLVVHTFVAMTVSTVALALVLWVSLAVAGAIWSLDIRADRVAAAVANTALLGLVLGSLALALGAASGRKGTTIGVAAALGFAAYLVNSLATVVDAFRSLRKASPFYYYGEPNPLLHGFDLGSALTLAAISLILLALAVFAFERRDLGVG